MVEKTRSTANDAAAASPRPGEESGIPNLFGTSTARDASDTPTAVSFWQEFFWEFVQNIVLLTAFFVALALWRQGRLGWALVCVLVGGVLGAWNIRWIEAKFKGHAEPFKVTWTNSAMMPLLMAVFVAYLAAAWSGWLTDVLIGAVGGFALSAAQRLSIKARLDVARSVAFAVAFPLTLLSIRALSALPLPLTILASTFVVTLLIVAIHQGSKKWKKEIGDRR